jgi:hypothetical protein
MPQTSTSSILTPTSLGNANTLSSILGGLNPTLAQTQNPTGGTSFPTTLPGTTQAGSGAYGTVPGAANPAAATSTAIATDASLDQQLQALVQQMDTMTATGALQQYEATIPNYDVNALTESGNINSELSGELSPSTMAMLNQQGAEYGLQTGMSGSPAANAAALRALGLTSQQLQEQGVQDLSTEINQAPKGTQFDPSTMLLTPSAEYQAMQLANTLGAAPNPTAAATANDTATTSGINSGAAAGGAPGGAIGPITSGGVGTGGVGPTMTGQTPSGDVGGGAGGAALPGQATGGGVGVGPGGTTTAGFGGTATSTGPGASGTIGPGGAMPGGGTVPQGYNYVPGQGLVPIGSTGGTGGTTTAAGRAGETTTTTQTPATPASDLNSSGDDAQVEAVLSSFGYTPSDIANVTPSTSSNASPLEYAQAILLSQLTDIQSATPEQLQYALQMADVYTAQPQTTSPAGTGAGTTTDTTSTTTPSSNTTTPSSDSTVGGVLSNYGYTGLDQSSLANVQPSTFWGASMLQYAQAMLQSAGTSLADASPDQLAGAMATASANTAAAPIGYDPTQAPTTDEPASYTFTPPTAAPAAPTTPTGYYNPAYTPPTAAPAAPTLPAGYDYTPPAAAPVYDQTGAETPIVGGYTPAPEQPVTVETGDTNYYDDTPPPEEPEEGEGEGEEDDKEGD